MPSTTPQARYWLLTLHMPCSWTVPTRLPQDIVWLRGQREIGSNTGAEHWQIFVAYSKKVRRARVKQDFTDQVHAEPSRSQAAEEYVWKEDTAVPGTRFELGGKQLNRNSREFWDSQLQLARRGNIKDCEPDIQLRYYSTLKRIAADAKEDAVDLTAPCGIWIVGPPGVGKSTFARKCWPDIYFKMINKWWDGYEDQKSVLIDDFSIQHGPIMGYYLKIWADQYVFRGEVKGGTIKIRPDRVVVTSNYTIEEIFATDAALYDAIKRRFYLINIPNKRF